MLEEHFLTQLAVPGFDILSNDLLKVFGIDETIGQSSTQIFNNLFQGHFFRCIKILQLLHIRQGPILCKGVLITYGINEYQSRYLLTIEPCGQYLRDTTTEAMAYEYDICQFQAL